MIILALVLAAAPVDAPASRPEITKETRPDLFADEPPSLLGSSGEKDGKTPPNETPTSFWLSNLLRTTAVLGVVVLLAYLILNKGLGRIMKLTGVATSGKHMTLMERLTLGPRHSLWLIEVDGRRIIVGTGENTTTLVATLDEKGDMAPVPAKENSKPA